MVIRAFVPGEMTETMTTTDEERLDSMEARLKETKKRVAGIQQKLEMTIEMDGRMNSRMDQLSKQIMELKQLVLSSHGKGKEVEGSQSAPATEIATVEVRVAETSTCFKDIVVDEVENCFGMGNRKFPDSSKPHYISGAQNMLDKMPEQIGEGDFTMKTKENLDIARQLTRLGVDITVDVFPSSYDAEFEAVKLMANEVGDVDSDRVPIMCALASCNKRDIDKAREEVQFTKKPMINATKEIHMMFKPKMILEQVIEKARNRVVGARRMGAFCDNVLSFPSNCNYVSSRDLKFAKHVHDNVHGSIYLDTIFLKFIDTGQFWWLCDLTQLRRAHMVYTGALNSSFEHSLGFHRLVGETVHKLQTQQGNELGIDRFCMQIVKLAGPLHDIGRRPYSYLFGCEFLPKAIYAPEWFYEQMLVEMVGHIVDVVDTVFLLLKGVSVLKIVALGIKYVQKVNFVGLPSIRAIDMGVRSLVQIEAITVKNDIYELTVGGWEMVKLGIEPRLCKIILECFCLCLGREGLVLGALMESYNIIFCRFSKLVNQLKSDCFKVQFCHPSDDTSTLLTFYKEWDDVPRKKKNSWENPINPKSLRKCLDTLLKLEAWLKSELNLSLSNYWCWDSKIPTEHDKNLKNILFPLLVNYVAMYYGYDHLGYEVALTKKLVQLHPSCCLLNFGQRTDGVVFGVIISSSKEYLVCVSSCEFEYLPTLSSCPRFDFLNMPLLKNHVGAGDRVFVDLPPLDESGQVLLLPVKMLNRSIAKKINSAVGQMWCSRRVYNQRRRCGKMRPRCSSVFPTFSHEVMAVNGGWFVM